MRNMEDLQCMSASLSVSVHQWLRQRLATTAPLLPLLVFKYSHPPPLSLLLLIPLYISQSGLKIDENLLWDYVLRAANNVEEPPGVSLPKQRSNKTRSWEIHGYLIETEASELFTGSLSALVFLHPALVCLACPPVSHLGGDLVPAVPCSLQPPTPLPQTRSACRGNNARTGASAVIVIVVKSDTGLWSMEQVTKKKNDGAIHKTRRKGAE